MVNYLDSRRIAGTTAERSSVPIPATSGGWVELGRTTLGSTSDTITVSGLPDKRYYMLLGDYLPSGNINGVYRMNNDTGTNYARRNSGNGATDTTATSQTYFQTDTIAGNNYEQFDVGYVANLSSKEKLIQMWTNKHDGNGAATVTKRIESVGKWANTSNAINRFDTINVGTGDFASGSELVVLGYDPADTHTTNFWEELADVTLGSAGDTLSSGTITAKKYLWVQVYTKATGGTIQQRMRFNSDSGNNYAERYSQDGGADGTITNDGELLLSAAPSTPAFTNMFIINNQSNEKLVVGHNVNQGGVGAANDPERYEFAHKWANTSNQITQIDIINTGTGDFDTGSFIKVWGSD